MVEGARFVGWRQALGGSAEIRGWRWRCGGEDERDQTPTFDHVPTVRSFLRLNWFIARHFRLTRGIARTHESSYWTVL